MKRVNYIIPLSTNLPEDLPQVGWSVEELIKKSISDYQTTEIEMETSVNDKVNISIDTTDIEINDFGDCDFFAYLICNDDVEMTGIADEIYEWLQKELISFVEYINKTKPYYTDITKGIDESVPLVIRTDEIDADFLDGCIDEIDDYYEG